jgi:hypothetical protein
MNEFRPHLRRHLRDEARAANVTAGGARAMDSL